MHLVFCGLDPGIEYCPTTTSCSVDLVVNHELWDIRPRLLQLSELLSGVAGSVISRTTLLLFSHRFDDGQIW